MKSLTGLWISVTRECAEICGVCADQDIVYALDRYENEELSFFTIALPNFGADFDTSVSRGFVDSDLFQGFTWRGGLPRFLSGFLRRIFDQHTGVLLRRPSVYAIRSVRQICYLLKKVRMRCTPEREAAAIQKYLDVEMELRDRETAGEWTEDDYLEFSRMAVLVFGQELSSIDHQIYIGDVFPKHGPGKVSDKLEGNQKWTLPCWTDRLEEIFPFVDYGLPNHRYWESHLPDFLSQEEEPPVKVTLVPKTLKTPRVIAQEPTHMQYMQQGLLQTLVRELESGDSDSSFVGFSNQEVNRLLARKGSLDGSFATIDLSDASDRVLNSLVDRGLCRRFPWLREALSVTRSTRAILPTGRIVPLVKFASMGSATCFPVEALVFATIAFLGIQRGLGRVLTPGDIKSFRGSVRVYGDDIIVPTEHASTVTQELHRFGLVVNTAKSFSEGNFRESCGGDYFRGEWVTPLRVSTVAPEKWTDVAETEAWFALSNNLHKAGYWKAAEYVASQLRLVYGELPIVPASSRALGLHSFTGVDTSVSKWDSDLHLPLIKAFVVEGRAPRSKLSGSPALLKCFRFDWSDPVESEHLQRSGRPKKSYIRTAWVSSV
jgi:hypothetical protein